MELPKGKNLESFLESNTNLDFKKIIAIIGSIAEILDFAHNNGILHRDIKPANIWIETKPDGAEKVRILDFGLAVNDDKLSTLTMTGQLLGTPAYMPPEQTDGNGKLTRASDLFSLGCIFYLLVTGKKVFPGANLLEILKSQAFFKIVPPCAFRPDIPPGLEQLILWLLQKSPEKRPQSAALFLEKTQKPKFVKISPSLP